MFTLNERKKCYIKMNRMKNERKKIDENLPHEFNVPIYSTKKFIYLPKSIFFCSFLYENRIEMRTIRTDLIKKRRNFEPKKKCLLDKYSCCYVGDIVKEIIPIWIGLSTLTIMVHDGVRYQEDRPPNVHVSLIFGDIQHIINIFMTRYFPASFFYSCRFVVV